MTPPAITTEFVIGAVTIIGLTVLTLKKFGFITFGKPVERRDCARQCADHERVVRDAAMATQEARAATGSIKEDITEIRDNIRRIEEKSERREQSMQDEFRQIRELLGELSGYVKAIHGKDK